MKSNLELSTNMIKYDFTYLSSDKKTNIHAIICYPKDEKYIGVIQILHGKREYIERYLPFMEYLTTIGFIAVGHDHLGHGQSVQKKEDLGYIGEPEPNDLLINDIHLLKQITQKKFPNLPYFMLGHSMGSYLLRHYITLHSEGVLGIIIMGTGFENTLKVSLGMSLCQVIAFFKGQRHVSNLITKLSYGKKFNRFDITKKDIYNSWITSDPEMAKINNEDTTRNYEFTLNAFIGLLQSTLYSCNPSNIAKVRKDLKVLFVSGGDDPIGNFGEGVRQAYDEFKKAGVKDVTIKIYEKDRHEVLNEVNRKEVFEFIGNWMVEKINVNK